MPFRSRRQQRFAFATRQPWAKRWANETPSFAALPESKDAGTTAGAPLHGPGGLLGFAGLRRRMKATKITGNLYRGDTGQFQAGGASTSLSAAPTRKPPAASATTAPRRKPAKTDQERTERRQADQQARQATRAQEQAENRANVLRSLNIAPDGAAALDALRRGEQPDPAAIARAGFVDAGLVEQASDGSYRMTPTGRALLSAADSGDRGRAGDTISGGRDRVSTRRQRQQAAAARKKPKAPPVAAGGGKEKPKPAIDVTGRMARINARLAKMRKRRNLRSPEPIRAAPQKRTDDRTAPQGPLDRRQTMKAQAAEQKAMFAKMGGGGSGGGGGAAGSNKAPTLWEKNPKTGKRDPQMGLVHENLFGPSFRARQTEVKARGEAKDRARAQQEQTREQFFRAQTASVSAPSAPKVVKPAPQTAQPNASHGLAKSERYAELEGLTTRVKMPQPGWNQPASDKQKGYLGSLLDRARMNTKEDGENRRLADAIIAANKSGKLTKWESSQLIDAMQRPKPFSSLMGSANARDSNPESPWRALLALPTFRTSLINHTLNQEADAEGLPF